MLLLAGHEPGWSASVGGLIGGADVHFPTAAMARVDVGVEQWSRVAWGRGALAWHLTPKLPGRLGGLEG